MIRDAIEKIIELSGPHIVSNQTKTLMYSDKKLLQRHGIGELNDKL